MKYILTEAEYKKGSQIFESWKESNLDLVTAYKISNKLIKQGYYTLIHAPDSRDPEIYEVIVFQKVQL